ncbi:phosphoglucosamine mutase [Umezakia ovalisporum]|jgi:phosphoglucosamine mutase|uniref:phosphoglucosamine mutase n=1 Tax=Umezakia ovalisporum TaxID=75695 RepID=UPI0006EEFD74|nr:phosphoglucosamine mutase [Umezakia ovalisporum]MBI1241341.1 phosphoglucosamine mutase [Nostoc sp. RI_552]MDH6066377.1 phosphoglucosamine mutase [Umezakia ovalisporum APH033B]MDH6084083.1 phosphoglucosamine mutase [Umezakia ovalisporum TAC611]MDH6090082.1 phosphoglucosamine mutase [Umezakia ovalisporum Ak1311]CEJ43208.1 Phosphoglucosamine mutase [Umezakia ovalisporum]
MVTSINRTQEDIRSSSKSESHKTGKGLDGNFALNHVSLPTTALFGTDGIRGQVGELLNAPLALQVGFWTGVVLKNHSCQTGPVILGQDSRNSSDMLAMALSAGLTAAGVEVWYLGLCPTPTVAHLTSISEAIGGVMISASHNPPEDNGIKIFNSNGAKLSPALQTEIESGLRGHTVTDKVSNCGRHYSRGELVNQYGKTLKQSLEKRGNLQGLKIVLDLAWGAAVSLAPQVFIEMGAEVICLHNQADGHRINVNCGSTHLATLQATVKEHDADLGFAFDGDADRVLAVDHTGRKVDGDYILYLWGRHLQQQQQLPDHLIVSTVMANLGFEKAWQKQGGKLIRTAVGDQYVQAEMIRTGGMLGGEQSGHILCRHYAITGDGLLTALHIAALVKEAGVPLSELIDQSFQTYPQLLRNVRVLDRDRRLNWQDCQPLQQAIALAEAAMGDAGRILVRASGTEPVIRVMVEAANTELANHWTDELVFQVQQHLIE